MRKLMCLMLVISGVSMGCGDSADDKAANGGSTAGDGATTGGEDNTTGGGEDNTTGGGITLPDAGSECGEKPDPYPMCDKPAATTALGSAGAKWTMDPPWTMDDYAACMKTCSDGTLQCFQDNCNKGMEFVDCFTGEIGACSVNGDAAPCKTEWTNLGCCAVENKCNGSQDAFSACVAQGSGPCSGDLGGWSTCAQTNCQNMAATACISTGGGGGSTTGEPNVDAGTTPVETDAGTSEAAMLPGAAAKLSAAAFAKSIQLLH